MTYQYQYITDSAFSPAVEWHFFKLRCVPCSNEFQQVVESRLQVTPACQVEHSVDGQGNAVQWGAIGYQHDGFRVASEGRVEQHLPYALHEVPASYYLTATRLTECHEKALRNIRGVTSREQQPFALAQAIMRWVHYYIAYTPGHTTTTTAAMDVFADPRGVCQDYAHLMIALCRAVGLHARYVNGFIAGEGQTHAWVEVSDGKVWLPFDPTHNTQPEWGYVKIAHGRDADDCPTNRGRIYGWTSEQQSVTVTMISNPVYSI